MGDGPSAADNKGRKAKAGGGPGAGKKGPKGAGSPGNKAARKSASSSSSSSRSGGSRGPARRAGAIPSLGTDASNVFSRLGKLGSEEATGSGGARDKKKPGSGVGSSSSGGKGGTGNEGKGGGQEGGVMQMVAAVGDSLSAGAAAFQERFSELKPQNVTLLFGGGKVANVTVPWKSVGIYGGGLLSGLALAAGLLTVPYTELGSPGLRKSLTLFENVLVDIDQVSELAAAGLKVPRRSLRSVFWYTAVLKTGYSSIR